MASAALIGPSASAIGGFNPLQLFECTITNASMLVDSMPTRDLLAALRVLTGLHSHIVEVIEPSVSVACQLADAHRACRCCQQQQQPPATSQSVKSDRKLSISAAAAASDEEDGNNSNVEDDDDDCVMIIEEDEEETKVFQQGGSSGPAREGRGDNGTDGADGLTKRFKVALMQCYKEMKGSGTHLFDFNKPFEDPGNEQVARSVVANAQAKMGSYNLLSGQWLDAVHMEIFNVFGPYRLKNKKSYNRTRRKQQKLARRQKALECALPDLQTDDLPQYRVVLTREFTSSDEESEDEYGRVSLRAREFDWESDRVREIKRRLDELFLKRFATQKQRLELARHLRRDGRSRSTRPPPECAPGWALGPAFRKSGGMGGGGAG